MTHKVLLLPGDGIGPEIAAQAARLLKACQEAGLDIEVEEALVGGSPRLASWALITRRRRRAGGVMVAATGAGQRSLGWRKL